MPILLVIDMQEDFLQHPELKLRRGPLVRAIRELVEAFRARGHSIVWVKQEFEADLSDAYLEMKRRKLAVVVKGSPRGTAPSSGRITERYLDGKMAHVWSNPRILAALDSQQGPA